LQGNQYSVKVFEVSIEDEEEFISFFDFNHILFTNRLIVLHGEISDNIREYLNSKSLCFLENIDLPKKSARNIVLESGITNTDKKTKEEIEKKVTEEFDNKLNETKQDFEEQKAVLAQENKMLEAKLLKLLERLKNNLTVLDHMIRSGQELNIDGDLLLLGRVNSGATINIEGSLIVTQVIEGAIRCNGNFMMISSSPKANIVFNNIEVNSEQLKDGLNRVELKDGEIIITPILEKEINWVQL